MTANTTTGSRVLVFADWGALYGIADRVGMTAEIVPQLMGVTNARPIGARGLYVYWRTGGAVVVPNAGRYLEVK
jgi:HK97 family phage major capsid protein